MSDAKVKFFKAYNGTDQRDAAPGEEVWFTFACPKYERTCGFLPIRDRTGMKHDPQNKNGGKAHWGWNGNRDKPTFTPSIDCGPCWHGYIENGRCVSVQKVDEPEPEPRK